MVVMRLHDDDALCGGCHPPKRPIVRPQGSFESTDSFDLRHVEIPGDGGENYWTFCVGGCGYEQLQLRSMVVHAVYDVGSWKDQEEDLSSLLMWGFWRRR